MWTGIKPFPGSDRERAFYRILGALSRERRMMSSDCLRNSCARSYVQVSATHISTAAWHVCFEIPFKSLMADKALLQARGYLLYEDLHTVEPFLGEEYAGQDQAAQAQYYGLASEPVSWRPLAVLDEGSARWCQRSSRRCPRGSGVELLVQPDYLFYF